MESTIKLRLPLSRVKKISKLEPTTGNISSDAAHLLTLATEKYIELLSKSAWNWTLAHSRKIMYSADIEDCIQRDWMFAILEDALSDWPDKIIEHDEKDSSEAGTDKNKNDQIGMEHSSASDGAA